MGNTIINQSQTINKTTKKVENEVRSTVNNINVDLSNIDMSGAIESFKQLEVVAKAANFDVFIEKVLALKDAFTSFQKSVQTSKTSITNFTKSIDQVSASNTAIVTTVDIDTSHFGEGVTAVANGVSSAASAVGGCFENISKITSNLGTGVEKSASAIGSCFEKAGNIALNFGAGVEKAASAVGSCFEKVGNIALNFGTGVEKAASSVSTMIDSITNLTTGFKTACEGVISLATGVSMLIPLLPALGTSVLTMAENMGGLLSYLPELIIFTGIMAVFALLGDGLALAGEGLKNIGLGLDAMTAGMAALLTFMPIFIASLADITANIGGIILFVLLAASMIAMAIALQMMNDQMQTFVESMEKLHSLMTVGFVAAFVVFGAMLIAMSFFIDKVAKGMDKLTESMTKQAGKLAILNPLLAVQAVLTNPIVGAITVAAAVASGLVVGAVFPAMATGGVVSSPTIAMIGEGKYPEAVVPLGDSPQFAGMKSDIANAVVQAMRVTSEQKAQTTSEKEPIVLNIDGKTFARLILPQLKKEGYRHGYDIAMKGI